MRPLLFNRSPSMPHQGNCTVSSFQQQAAQLLPGGESALEMDLLLVHVTAKSRTWLRTWPDQVLSDTQVTELLALLRRRRTGEPIAYILGEQAFWTLQLRVTPDVLIPRPDTECVVEKVLELGKGLRWRVADLGTGSGAIALSLAKEHPDWDVTATDLSHAALAIAQENAKRNDIKQVSFLQGSWLSPLSGHYHCIVSNPPYIDGADPHLLSLTHEPQSALVADDAGLADLWNIAQLSGNFLSPDGWLVLEHGHDQHDTVQALLKQSGFVAVDSGKDYGGNWRYTFGQQPHAD